MSPAEAAYARHVAIRNNCPPLHRQNLRSWQELGEPERIYWDEIAKAVVQTLLQEQARRHAEAVREDQHS